MEVSGCLSNDVFHGTHLLTLCLQFTDPNDVANLSGMRKICWVFGKLWVPVSCVFEDAIKSVRV